MSRLLRRPVGTLLSRLPFLQRRENDWRNSEFRLDGTQIFLRPLRLGDADAMFAYASDPEVTRFLPWYPAIDLSAVQAFLLQQVTRRKRGESCGFAIVEKESDTMIGSTDLMGLLVEPVGGAELGYLLAQPFWGRGIMSEAAKLTLAFGFGTLKLRRVAAFADIDNLGSRRVLEKSGLSRAGSERRLVKGHEREYVRYEIDASSFARLGAKLEET